MTIEDKIKKVIDKSLNGNYDINFLIKMQLIKKLDKLFCSELRKSELELIKKYKGEMRPHGL